jgi:hypothetical protein
VEKNCYNCGAAMDERPFCPSCGTAQIRVSPREETPEALEPQPGANDPATLQHSAGYSAVAMPGSPSNIQWKKYFKTAWPLALVAGIATGVFPPVGFLLFLPVAVIVSLRLYRKHHFGPIRTGQGALLGAALSVLSFAVFALLFQLYYSGHSQEIKDALTSAMNDQLSRNPNPDAAGMMRSLLNSPGGMLAFVGFALFVVFCFNTLFGSLAGALAATFGQDKPKL